ncbi:MAG: prolyl-tRNA synthetase associated domain-containing protein [Proteobacteria bacterium]|nr:prolyl-tRNA synthetase associated domain-containing protein [Pseudomonadota bacterium]
MPHTPQSLFEYLKHLGVEYTLYEHPAVFTVEEAREHCGHIPGVHCKNLFLRDKKEAMWLVTAPDERVIDLKALNDKIGAKRLSFGRAERLMKYLGLLPGSVTPLGLINDKTRMVQPVLDAWMMQQEMLNVHPLVNTATITLTPAGLNRFLEAQGYHPIQLDLSVYTDCV